MSGHKFKVGDRVVKIRGYAADMEVGDRATVISDSDHSRNTYVELDDKKRWDDPKVWAYREELEFESIVDSPLYKALR